MNAVRGTFGFASNQNVSTRWAHPSFDSDLCFAPCHSLGDVLNKLRDVRTVRASAFNARYGASVLFCIVSLRVLPRFVYAFLLIFLFGSVDAYAFETMDAPGSSLSSDVDEYDEHNIWNPFMDLICSEHVSAVMEAFLDIAVLGKNCIFLPFCTRSTLRQSRCSS